MLPRALCQLSCRALGDGAVPRYLTPRDEPWLATLLAERARFDGQRAQAFREALRASLPESTPKTKLQLAARALDALSQPPVSSGVPAREARALVFRAAAGNAQPRDEILSEAARTLGVSLEQLEAALFADLNAERRVGALPEGLTTHSLALEANRSLLSALLRLAARVELRVWGDSRELLKQVRGSGLLCLVASLGDPGALSLEISGPFAVFRHSQIYGRALAALLPRICAQPRFELEASCVLQRGAAPLLVRASSADPLPIQRTLHPNEARSLQRFATAFRRVGPDWELRRDPAPTPAGASLLFADFELCDRLDAERHFQLEIVGFWTREYLRAKLALLDAHGLRHWLLYVDERRACQSDDLPDDPRIIRFRSRPSARAVLEAMLQRF